MGLITQQQQIPQARLRLSPTLRSAACCARNARCHGPAVFVLIQAAPRMTENRVLGGAPWDDDANKKHRVCITAWAIRNPREQPGASPRKSSPMRAQPMRWELTLRMPAQSAAMPFEHRTWHLKHSHRLRCIDHA